MGYLHQGHLTLVERARAECDLVVMSIFVNPTQFGPQEDFVLYPRDLERDRYLAAEGGVDVLFVPDVDTMYLGGSGEQQVWVEPGSLADHLCGASRPNHFRGVATVVAKLFNMVQPDRAYFGQKDAQQAVIIGRMARDLSFPIEVRVIATVRESDGLALSSRNVYLRAGERQQAVALSTALERGRKAIEHGERDPRKVEQQVLGHLSESAPEADIDYVTVADLNSAKPLERIRAGNVLVALAVFFDRTRLIDNIIVRVDSAALQTDEKAAAQR